MIVNILVHYTFAHFCRTNADKRVHSSYRFWCNFFFTHHHLLFHSFCGQESGCSIAGFPDPSQDGSQGCQPGGRHLQADSWGSWQGLVPHWSRHLRSRSFDPGLSPSRPAGLSAGQLTQPASGRGKRKWKGQQSGRQARRPGLQVTYRDIQSPSVCLWLLRGCLVFVVECDGWDRISLCDSHECCWVFSFFHLLLPSVLCCLQVLPVFAV